jgi:CubicO group peptidase (beta-lactamase class C family)
MYNFGTTAEGQSLPPNDSTIYEIGSITKTFTTILLAHAVSEGKAAWNDDIRRYLNGDYPNLAFRGKPITLFQLANLTSSLPNSLGDPPHAYDHAPTKPPGATPRVFQWVCPGSFTTPGTSKRPFLRMGPRLAIPVIVCNTPPCILASSS